LDYGEVISKYIGAFVDELARCGVDQAVVCPGSRSTPLAVLLAEHPKITVRMHVDERSAGFFALGMAKAGEKPIALICSSGTAVANFLPAVVEAHYSRTPLLLLTADRPHELRDTGAPQAIDQDHIFGRFAKFFADVALPESSDAMQRWIRTMAAKAVSISTSQPYGPVHLNFPFREPLMPSLSESTFLQGELNHNRPYSSVLKGSLQLSDDELCGVADTLQACERGLIVCGPDDVSGFPNTVSKLADRLGFPVLADPLSQLRCGEHDKRWVIDTYDSFLRDSEIAEKLKPDLVIRFGAAPTSKALGQYIQKHSSCRFLVVDEGSGWREPTSAPCEMIYANPVSLCQQLSEILSEKGEERRQSRIEWADRWRKLNGISKQRLAIRGKSDSLSEGQIFLELAEILPQHANLFVGSGMPVRDLDSFFFCSDRRVRLFANRGANGIDGVVSTALGVSAVSDEACVLVIGDLSFYHDLNGLLAAKLHRLNLTVILVNNDGGGIFSFLPQAQSAPKFEELFGTPIGLDFSLAVKMYDGTFSTIETWNGFRDAVRRSFDDKGLHVIEVRTNRDENVRVHREIWRDISAVLRSHGDF
jgi:2-succinyl-5-enolpyruvyl-6-hydroxy-3-cyclohexene-1-carboxylate synthase